MILKLKDRTFDFSVDAPPSKSVYHRELIIRFLKGFEDDLKPSSGDSKDIEATKNCLAALREGRTVLDCNESGSTLRFMIPVACAYALKNGITDSLIFKTAGRLFDRPLDALEDCLAQHGISITGDRGKREFKVSGTLEEGVFTIDGSVSSQYVSGLLMALIILPVSSLEIKGEPSSVHYIELTRHIIAKYDDGSPDSLKELKVEGDWSGGAFLLCLKELINGSLTVGNLDKDSVQGDKEITDFLDACGFAELSWDCRDIPDIVPYMAVVAAFRNKKTVFRNIGRLRIKESDRVAAIREQLHAAGIRTEETSDTLTVYGISGQEWETFPCEPVVLKSYNDHRMVMSALLIAAALRRDIDIDSIEPVDKSFPGLREIIRKEFS